MPVLILMEILNMGIKYSIKLLISDDMDLRNPEQIKKTALENDNFLFLKNEFPKL